MLFPSPLWNNNCYFRVVKFSVVDKKGMDVKSVYRGLAIVILIVVAGCNGVKVVGNSVETHGDMSVTVADDYKYVDAVLCNDYEEFAACQRRSVNYRADLYVKDDAGELQAVCAVISKSATGDFSFWYDSGFFFNHEGIRYSGYLNRFDLNNLEDDPEVAAYLKVLQRHGFKPSVEKMLVLAASKRIDSHHKVVVGYAVPDRPEYSEMSREALREELSKGLFSAVKVTQGTK